MNISKLKSEEVQQFIADHERDDSSKLLLGKSPFPDVSVQELVQQIEGRRICKEKIPTFYQSGIIYPPKNNLEQSSSELTAKYKASILKEFPKQVLDCTGGFGVDIYFLAQLSSQADYCEIKEELYTIVSSNFEFLDRPIQCHAIDGIEYLKHLSEPVDLLFIDPSRREAHSKTILIEQSSPNIIEHRELLLNSCTQLLVKLSPMIDIDYLIQSFSGIEQIHICSVQNDVKELLFIASKQPKNSPISLVATNISKQGETISYQATVDENDIPEFVEQVEDYQYLYEAYKVVSKAKLSDKIAHDSGLEKLATHSHLYFSKKAQEIDLFKGFKILDFPKTINTSLGKELGGQINIVCKNFPLKPQEVMRKLKVKQGGNLFLYCSKQQKKSIYVLCKRLY